MTSKPIITVLPLLFGLFCLVACAQKSSISELESWNDATVISNMNVDQTTVLEPEGGLIFTKNTQIKIQEGQRLIIDSKLTTLNNRQFFFGEGTVDFKTGSVEKINVMWFGAQPDDDQSDSAAIQKAIDVAIYSDGVSVVYFPPGEYLIDQPLIAVRKTPNGNFSHFNLTLEGHQLAFNNPGGGQGGVSVLKTTDEIPFIFGFQGARGVSVDKLVFEGFISETFAIEDLIYKTEDELYPQGRYSPMAAIVIDPFSPEKPKSEAYEGLDEYYGNGRSSTRVVIKDGAIMGFPTGISLSPNGVTQQNDSVLIQNMRFFNLVYGVSISQTQSRNVAVEHCSFGRMKYAFTSQHFGEENGILPEVRSIKVADGVAWLYKANGNVAYGHFSQVYAEALYGIGYSIINKQPMHFEGCVFRFRPQSDKKKQWANPCILRADNASFVACTFTMGGGKDNSEPLLMDVKTATFINSYLDTEPINIGSDLREPNKTELLNNTLRKNKLESTNWQYTAQLDNQRTPIKYNKNSGHFVFTGKGYKVGDFVFGKTTLDRAPFEKTTLYTAIGKVVQVSGKQVEFVSDVIGENTTFIQRLSPQ